MPQTAFFTISAWNYLHFSKTLASSLARHHPECARILAFADTRRENYGAEDLKEFGGHIFFDELDLPDPRSFSFRYDVMELSTAIKPTVFLHLFDQGFDRVVYLDPDIFLYRPLDEVFAALDAGASSVLTPHGLAPNLSAEGPNDLTFMQNGAYNLGFLALADTKGTRKGLEWWAARLETQCVSNRLSDGIFVDQKFMDLWPSYCPGTHILRDPAYNVAYWNLDSRTVAASANQYQVDGSPLAFFHFSGLVPGNRGILSKHQQRWKPGSSKELQRLVNDYHDELECHGRSRYSAISYGFGAFSDGTPIPAAARIIFREQLEPFHGDPFATVPACLDRPAALKPNPGDVVNRLSHALWAARPDLQSHFPLRDAGSQIEYARWYVSGGAASAGIPERLWRPIAERLVRITDKGDGAPLDSSGASPLLTRAARRLYRLLFRLRPHIQGFYRWIPPERRRRLIDTLFNRAWPSAVEDGSDASFGAGLSLIGYPFSEKGLGEAMRSLARSVEAVGIDYDVTDFDLHAGGSFRDQALASRVTDRPSRAINVFCVNADMLGPTLRGVGQGVSRRRYNIVRPFWELPRIHPQWVADLEQIDEIWAPTTFVRDAFLAGTSRQVIHVPVAISIPPDIRPARARFRIPVDATAFLFAFDFASYPARKNPEAVVEAYRRAFGQDSRRQVALVMKTLGSSPMKEDVLASIRSLARADGRIVLIDEVLTRAEMYALTASCDVFVSLHRSEGFGLGIAEAMAMGKAVISTDFSGSKDFVTAETGFPVPYRLVDVLPDQYPYFIPGQKWADPDIDAAAGIMVRLANDPGIIQSVGEQARCHMESAHSPEAIGKIIDARLKDILASRLETMQRAS